jgi:peptidoglycan hydrolase-like protein with peptidoglycan-binding domain
MANIVKSVGAGGQNNKSDVRVVQALLNNFVTALGLDALRVDGDCGEITIEAIRQFQSQIAGIADPDGRIDPGGKSMQVLIGIAAQGAAARGDASLLSGATWWHANQARFGNSHKTADLVPGFREDVEAFIAAMRTGGANIQISSTRRNKIRAYLMHFSWRIAKGEIAASNVPPEPGCQIIWDHGNTAKSRTAAQEMKDLFNIAFKPSLTSNHIAGKAIDMTISWNGTLNMVDGQGRDVAVPPPSPGSLNAKLHQVGATYRVLKLLSDPPHWSTNGR